MEINFEKNKDAFESVPKVVAAIGSVFYFFGFLISVIHYGIFGILAIDFISAKYVLTGGVFAFYVMCWGSCIYAANFFKEKRADALKDKQSHYSQSIPPLIYGISMFLFTLGFSLLIDLLCYLLHIPYEFEDISVLKATFGPVFEATSIFIIMALTGVLNYRTDKPKNGTSLIDTKFFEFSLIIVSVTLCVFAYSYFIYSEIPTAFGGGKLDKISIILKEEKGNQDLRKLLGTTDTLNSKTKEVYLITETSTDFYLKLPDTSCVVILPKSAASGVILNR